MMKINLISGPRNVSTALMYAFAQRDDTYVVDEPFYAHYLEKSGVEHPGRDEVLQAQPVDEKEVVKRLREASEKKPLLFIKNMAHHLDGVDPTILSNMRNVFLIRNPREMILSFIRKVPEPTLKDTAYQQQYRLFRYVTHTLKQEPLVIDAAELLKNPHHVLKKVCNKLELPFDEKMLHWEQGPTPEDGVWAKYWYGNVHASMGFHPYLPTPERVPEFLEPLLENCQNYYKRIYKHAIKA